MYRRRRSHTKTDRENCSGQQSALTVTLKDVSGRVTTSETSCPEVVLISVQHRPHPATPLEKYSPIGREIYTKNHNGNWSPFFVKYNAFLQANYLRLLTANFIVYLGFIKQFFTVIFIKNYPRAQLFIIIQSNFRSKSQEASSL